jgi:hypothetical protein
LRVRSTQVVPCKLQDSKPPFSEGYVPSLAAMGEDVFLSDPRIGILALSPDGRVTRFNEQGGLASEKVWSLAALDGKLYAHVTTDFRYQDSGVMEVDPRTGQSRLLFSSRAKEASMTLDKKPIYAIVGDPKRHALWVLAGGKNQRQLYAYAPRTHTAEGKLADPSLVISTFLPQLQLLDDDLLIWGFGMGYQLISETGVAKVLYSRGDLPNSYPFRLVFVGSDRYGVVGRERELVLFRDGTLKKPEHMLDRLFLGDRAKGGRISDIAPHPDGKGLLVLTEDALYLVPTIQNSAPSQENAAKDSTSSPVLSVEDEAR